MTLCFNNHWLKHFKYLQINEKLIVSPFQVASSALGFGPQMAMQLAERLYTQGFIRFFLYLLYREFSIFLYPHHQLLCNFYSILQHWPCSTVQGLECCLESYVLIGCFPDQFNLCCCCIVFGFIANYFLYILPGSSVVDFQALFPFIAFLFFSFCTSEDFRLYLVSNLLEILISPSIVSQICSFFPYELSFLKLFIFPSIACPISYPRTESTAYPSSFDFRGALAALVNNPTTGSYVEKLLSEGFHKPQGGVDVGDHPPITPVKSATEDMLGIDAWRLYQYVCQHFLGSVSPDCKYIRQALIFSPHPLYMFCLSFLNVAKLGLFPSYDLAAFSPCGCAQSICFLTFFLPNSKIFLVKK